MRFNPRFAVSPGMFDYLPKYHLSNHNEAKTPDNQTEYELCSWNKVEDWRCGQDKWNNMWAEDLKDLCESYVYRRKSFGQFITSSRLVPAWIPVINHITVEQWLKNQNNNAPTKFASNFAYRTLPIYHSATTYKKENKSDSLQGSGRDDTLGCCHKWVDS